MTAFFIASYCGSLKRQDRKQSYEPDLVQVFGFQKSIGTSSNIARSSTTYHPDMGTFDAREPVKLTLADLALTRPSERLTEAVISDDTRH